MTRNRKVLLIVCAVLLTAALVAGLIWIPRACSERPADPSSDETVPAQDGTPSRTGSEEGTEGSGDSAFSNDSPSSKEDGPDESGRAGDPETSGPSESVETRPDESGNPGESSGETADPKDASEPAEDGQSRPSEETSAPREDGTSVPSDETSDPSGESSSPSEESNGEPGETSKPETYRISFETGIGRAPEPLSAGYGDEIELPSLSESGYVFEGWKAGGRLITDGRLTVTGSLTLVAEWSAVTAPLKLEYGIYEGNYYLSIDSEALSGSDSLREALHRLLTDGCRKRSYRQAYDDLETTDCYDGAFVECLYTGMKMDPDAHGYWNREHVWAKSHGFPSEDCPAFSDLHHLRATEGTVNSARGNSYFAVVTSPTDSDSYGNRWTDSAFEPRDEVKGDVARMMFYMVVRYEGAKEDGYLDLELTDNVGRASAQTETADPDGITRACFGLLSTLIRWSFEDPVDSKEITRNEAVYSLQKNRNPFIDYPELVWYLYPDECASLGYAREDLGDLISFRLKDDAAIARVQDLIDGISGAADKKTAVEAARAAFDALTYESRCFVRNYAALAEAEKELENQGGGEAFFDFTTLGGAREGTMTAGGVTVRYRSSSDNAPNSYGLYSQQGKNVVLTVEHADGVTSMTLTMDSNKGDGMSGTVTVTDGKKTVSAEYILFRNAPDDCVLDVSALDGSRTWTVTVASGSSWRIRSVSFAR